MLMKKSMMTPKVEFEIAHHPKNCINLDSSEDEMNDKMQMIRKSLSKTLVMIKEGVSPMHDKAKQKRQSTMI